MGSKIRLGAALLLLCLMPAMALAQTSLEGTVTAGETIAVTAPFGGTITQVMARAGQQVAAGEALATVGTQKAQAAMDGTVRGVFAAPGDLLSDTAVLYLAPSSKYTIACTIADAYATVANRYVRLGEQVYIRCKPDGSHKALGVVTAVSGSSFTVQTTAGELYLEETVYLYRSGTYAAKSRIGSGTVGRTAEIAMTASGTLLSLAVQDGQTVERGQTLFETVAGAVAGGAAAADVSAGTPGVVAEVKVSAGQAVQAGDVLFTLYPAGSEVIAFSMEEGLLGAVKVGQGANIQFHWREDSGQTVRGTVSAISYVPATDTVTAADGGQTDEADTSGTATYTGYVDFDADADVRLGMGVTVTLD